MVCALEHAVKVAFLDLSFKLSEQDTFTSRTSFCMSTSSSRPVSSNKKFVAFEKAFCCSKTLATGGLFNCLYVNIPTGTPGPFFRICHLQGLTIIAFFVVQTLTFSLIFVFFLEQKNTSGSDCHVWTYNIG